MSMTLMDSVVGDTKIVVDDSKVPAANVVYTSMKSNVGVCMGTCLLKGTSGNLTLIPQTQEGWVKSNTFTCPVNGWWMMWVCWGHVGPAIGTATATLNYKLNSAANVVMVTINNGTKLVSAPVNLVKGDTIVFPVTAVKTSDFRGTYCFEYIN